MLIILFNFSICSPNKKIVCDFLFKFMFLGFITRKHMLEKRRKKKRVLRYYEHLNEIILNIEDKI